MRHISHQSTSLQRRAKRVRAKLHSTSDRPRISVFRSNQHVFAQAINDDKGEVLAAAYDLVLPKATKMTKSEKAAAVGKALATQLKAKKITKAVFDRGAYRYHGRVKALAEAIRSEGIQV